MAHATAYTDCSKCHASGVVTFGFTVRSPWGRLEHAGRCPEPVRSTALGEAYAAYAAVHNAIKRWPALDSLLVKTDFRGLADGFAHGAGYKGVPRNPTFHRILAAMRRSAERAPNGPVRLGVDYVRGHQPSDRSAQAWLNGRAHALAYNALRS